MRFLGFSARPPLLCVFGWLVVFLAVVRVWWRLVCPLRLGWLLLLFQPDYIPAIRPSSSLLRAHVHTWLMLWCELEKLPNTMHPLLEFRVVLSTLMETLDKGSHPIRHPAAA